MAGHPLVLVLAAVILFAATPARAQEDSGQVAPDAAVPESEPLPESDAPLGPPPPPPDESSYPRYPGQPAPGYDATSTATVDDGVVPTGEAPAPPSDEHEHRGFFLRPHVGFGYMSTSGQGTELRGLAFRAGIMVGAAVVENLVVFGEFAFGISASANYDGPILPAPGERAGLTAALFGAGVAYYIMPFNLHVSLAADFLAMQITIGDRAILPEPSGFAFHVTLGKEWYFARRWALGIAAQSEVGFVGDYVLFGVGLAGTITFN